MIEESLIKRGKYNHDSKNKNPNLYNTLLLVLCYKYHTIDS